MLIRDAATIVGEDRSPNLGKWPELGVFVGGEVNQEG